MIKAGFSNEKKDGIQIDHREAEIDARRQAIERAGISISSVNIIKNGRLYEDFIESRSEAVLMPGYHLENIGYIDETTYKVVLIGRILTMNFGEIINSEQKK